MKTWNLLPANIIPVSELASLREQLSGQSIVLATGCFDILHIGHLRFLQLASQQGDILVVGVNSDSSIKIIKGRDRPIVNQVERIELIAAFRCVDFVFLHEDAVADEYIKTLRPQVFVIGEESVSLYPSETIAAKGVGARIYVINRIPAMSTTSILANLKSDDDKNLFHI